MALISTEVDMPVLSFHEDAGGCSLPPFNPVSNRLSFFRVNVFDMELPVDLVRADKPVSKGTGHGLDGLPFGHVRLGLPITDMFPDLVPEFGPQFLEGPRVRVRSGIFLPATSVNRVYSGGHLLSASTADLARKHVAVDGNSVVLKEKEWAALSAGQAASLLVGGNLIRVLPPRGAFPTGTPAASRPFFFSRSGSVAEPIPPRPVRDRNKLEPPRYEIGLISEYDQTWNLTGYSRGGLVSSLTLGPEEELLIEVFTWDRTKLEEERSETAEVERSVETSMMSRVSAQLNSELTETTDKNASFGLGASLPVDPIKVNVSGEGSVSNSISTSIQSTVDTIDEATQRASDRFKSTTQVKVVQTRDTGAETRVTRRLRNPNRGRTLTMHCFEVMEHYTVTTKLRRADKFVLMVEIPQATCFDRDFILAHEDKLQRALLSANYLPGFEAAKRHLAQQFFDERSLIKAEVEAAAAKLRGDDASAAAPPIVTVAKNMAKKLDRMQSLDLIQAIEKLANAYLPGNSISHEERAAAEGALGIFNFWLKFKTVTPGLDSRAAEYLDTVPLDSTPTARVAYEALASLTTGFDDEWLTAVKMLAASVVATSLGFNLLIPFPWLAPMLLQFAVLENNLGLPALIEKAKQTVRAYEVTLQQPPPPTEASKEVVPPPQLFSLQDLAFADAEFEKLVLHLEANRVYYMNSILAQQDANVRYESLRTLGIHGFVENRLLGFLGSRAIFPLRVENLEKEARDYLDLRLVSGLREKLANVKSRTEAVALPTSGLHMEPVLGQCDALEPFLVTSRAIELSLRQAEADQAAARAALDAAEVDRLQARLAADPPLLDPPFESPAAAEDTGI